MSRGKFFRTNTFPLLWNAYLLEQGERNLIFFAIFLEEILVLQFSRQGKRKKGQKQINHRLTCRCLSYIFLRLRAVFSDSAKKFWVQNIKIEAFWVFWTIFNRVKGQVISKGNFDAILLHKIWTKLLKDFCHSV